MKGLRVGIVGSSGIAIHFANACKAVPGVEAVGVYSRSRANRLEFLQKTRLSTEYVSLEDMLCDPQINLVYVATPHAAHYEAALKAIQARKHVLCEKPLCLSYADSLSLFENARQQGVFLMEGMWSRFLPVTEQVTDWLREERIGQIRFIDAMFSFAIEPRIPRLFDPAMGGGAMYDTGVYAIQMSSWYASEMPCEWHGVCKPYCEGVDASSAMVLRYPSGVLTTIRVGIDCDLPEEMLICGEKGMIRIPKFHRPNEAFLYCGSMQIEHVSRPFLMPEGFTWQIAKVRDCLALGKTVCETVPPEASLSAAKIMEDMMYAFFPKRIKS